MVPIERVNAWAYTVPADAPEADGTSVSAGTILVAVGFVAGNWVDFGCIDTRATARDIIADRLAGVLRGHDALAPRRYGLR
jgi:hypothetical protein